MPCFDAQGEEDRKQGAKRYDAMTAILCGVIRAASESAQYDPAVLGFAERWYAAHEQVDELRKTVKYDFQNPEIGRYLSVCRSVLDEAYLALCLEERR